MSDLSHFGHLVSILGTHNEKVRFKAVVEARAVELARMSSQHGPSWIQRQPIDYLKRAACAVEPLAPGPNVLVQVQPVDDPVHATGAVGVL